MDIHRIRPILSIIKPEHSPLFRLGKFFFKRAAPWEQRVKMVNILWSIFVGLFAAAFVLVLIYFEYHRH